MTLKASPLSNRGYERSEHPRGWQEVKEYDSEGVAAVRWSGHPFRVHSFRLFVDRGCSLRSYPRLLSGDGFTVLSSAIES